MLPEERAEYFARRAEQSTAQQIAQLRAEMADSTDRAAFAAATAANPALARVAPKVEEMLAEHRRNTGATLPREVIAKFLIGEQVLAKANKAGASQRKNAAARVASQAGRPVAGGGNAPATPRRAGGDDRAARLARLEGQQI